MAQLPNYSPAWALTIHRSQGSEFDEVLVILPRQESPMTTRELIYTTITRARKTVYIAGDLESVRKAASNPSGRITMVGAHLECAGVIKSGVQAGCLTAESGWKPNLRARAWPAFFLLQTTFNHTPLTVKRFIFNPPS